MQSVTPPVLYLVGPTASGKTAAALMLARYFPVEIISMDSALVYCDMNIGTAKPTAAERLQAPHHLIDILDPAIPYSAATFAADAHRLINEIRGRNRLPLVVGGTMLYFKALTEGLSELPSANLALRQQLDEQAAHIGWPAMHARLAQYDAVTAARLAPNDAQRIQRALEIILLSGTPMSTLLQERKSAMSLPGKTLALEPSNRAVLHERIARRFDQMLADGLIDEVAQLRSRSDLTIDTPAMRCVGYRQTWQYLDGTLDRTALREQGIAATRQLAKRQLTWLRSVAARQAIACDAGDYLDQVLTAARRIWPGSD